MKIAKATITALLYTSKTLANGEHPVMIRVCYNGKRKYKSTGLSCPAKLWNTAKQEVRGRHPLSMNMNALIESELMCLKNKVLDAARASAREEGRQLIENAQKEADKVIRKAGEDARREKDKMLEQAKHEILSLVLDAAAGSMNKKSDDSALYDEFLKKAGTTENEET
jgi:vacuolar-type H+-ATPase subunit H